MGDQIYQEVNNVGDITEINEEIRKEIRNADSRDMVTELKRRSRYLVVLLSPYNPTGIAKKLKDRGKLESAQQRAWQEYEKTTNVANKNKHGGDEYSIGQKPDYV